MTSDGSVPNWHVLLALHARERALSAAASNGVAPLTRDDLLELSQ